MKVTILDSPTFADLARKVWLNLDHYTAVLDYSIDMIGATDVLIAFGQEGTAYLDANPQCVGILIEPEDYMHPETLLRSVQAALNYISMLKASGQQVPRYHIIYQNMTFTPQAPEPGAPAPVVTTGFLATIKSLFGGSK